MKNQNIKFKVHQTKESIQLVLAELLLKKMHRTEGEPGVRSLMENVATGERKVDGLTLVSLVSDGEMIGLAMCIHAKNASVRAHILNNPTPKSKVKATRDWSYVAIGHFSVYIREDCRGQGLAKMLLARMEEVRLSELKDEGYFKHPEDRGVFYARMGSVGLIQKYGRVGILEFDLMSSANTRAWNHWETTAIDFEMATTTKPQFTITSQKNTKNTV